MISKKAHKPILASVIILSILILSITSYFVLADEPEEQPTISRTSSTDTSCLTIPEERQIINENQCLDFTERNWTDINCEQYNRKPTNNCNIYNNYIVDTDCSRHNVLGNRTNSSALGGTPRSIMTCIKDSNSVWDGFECKDICSADSYCELTPSGNNETDYICVDNGYFDNYESDCNNLDGCSWSSNTCNFDIYDYSQDEIDCLANSCGWENNNCFDDIENSTYCAGGFGDVIRDEIINKQQCTKTLYSGLMNYDNGTEFVPIELDTQSSSYLDYEYELTTAPYHAYFQNNIQAGKGFRFETNGYWFTYDLSGGKMQWAVENKSGTEDWGKTKSIGSILSSSPDVYDNIVQYNNSFLNTDVQYVLQNELVKENFVLSSLPAGYGDYLYLEYIGEIQFDNNLTIWANGEIQTSKEFTTSGRVDFKDSENQTVYYLPVPVATDSNDSSVNLIYDIKPNAEKLTFGLKTPISWLSNVSRVYPVKIDPTVTLQTADTENLEDTYITYTNPTTNWGNGFVLATMADNTSNGASIYIKFDISIWDFSSISKSNFSLYLYNNGLDSSETANIDVHHLANQSWVETYPTWINRENITGINSTIVDTYNIFGGAGEPVNQWISWNVTSAFLIDSGINNNFSLYINCSNLSDSVYRDSIPFRSKEYATTSQRPKLEITFTGDVTISDCATLNAEGATYILDSDITDSSTSNCIDITANNVVLDCQGNTIDGNDAADVGIYLNSVTNVTIKNCSLTDWDSAGIRLNGATLNRINNTNISSCPDEAIELKDSSNNNNLTFVTLYDNNYGIELGSGTVSSGLSVYNSNISSNTIGGLYEIGSAFTIEDTYVMDNLYDFFEVGFSDSYCGSLNNVTGTNFLPIYEVSASEVINDWDNVSMFYVCNADNSVFNNVTLQNVGIGMIISGESSNVVIENSTFTNLIHGIFEDAINDQIIIKSINITNTTYGITTFGINGLLNLTNSNIQSISEAINVAQSLTSAANIYNNILNATIPVDVIPTGTTYRSWNTTKSSNTRIFGNGYYGGNYYTNSSNTGYSNTCTDANYDGICDSSLTHDSSIYDIDYLPLSDEGTQFQVDQPTSGQTFTQDIPTAYFNITSHENMSNCVYSFDSGVNNYSMTNATNSTYWSLSNTTMVDGAHTANFWCNASDDGEWFTYPVGITFDVDSVNVTVCRDLSVANREYFLRNDITSCSDANNFRILANNITFEGNDYNITLFGITNEVIDTYNGTRYHNITIRNLKINTTGDLAIIVSGDNYILSNLSLYSDMDGTLSTYDVTMDNLLLSNSIINTNSTTPTDTAVAIISENSQFINNNITSENGMGVLMAVGVNNSFIDSTINSSSYSFKLVNNFEAIIINVTYLNNKSESIEANSNLTRLWYFSTQVNDSAGYVENAQVDIYNNTGLVISELTDASGSIGTEELIEYINNGGTKTYANNYEINVSKATYTTNTTNYNLTTEQNIVHYVTLDLSNTAPSTLLSTPLNNYWSSTSSNEFICNSTDAEGNLKNITLYLWNGTTTTNTTSITGSTNSTTISYSLADDTYNWSCYVCDDSDSCAWNETNRTVNVDATYPIVNITYPSNHTNSSDTSLNINYTSNDTNLDTCWYSNDSYAINTTLASCINITGLTWIDGSHNVTVWVNDSANNINSSFIYFTIDATYPIINITYPANNTHYTDTGLEINYTYVETNCDSVWYTNDTYATNTTLACGTNITTITWTEGNHNVTIWMNDTANNINLSFIAFTIDTTNPLIDYDAQTEANESNFSRDFIYVNITLTETNFQNMSFALYNDTDTINQTNYTTATSQINWTGLDDNNYTYQVNVTDKANNKNYTGLRIITIDDTAPTVDVIEPLNDTSHNHYNLTINYTVSDNLIGLDSCWYTNDTGVNNYSITCGTNFTQNLSQGAHTIYIYSNDSLNNIGSDSVTYTISTTSPATSLNAPSNNEWLDSGTNIYFNFTSTDGDGLSVCELWGNWTGSWHNNYTWRFPTNATMNWTQVNVSEGEYKWNVWCNDTLNNGQFATNNFTFGVDITNPLIDYDAQTPADFSNLSQDFIYINITLTETNFQNITFILRNSEGIINTTTYTTATYEINWTNGTELRDDNNYTYYVNITDKANNVNSTEIRNITLDTTNPNITLVRPGNNTYNSTASINFTANISDNLGIKNATITLYNSTGQYNQTDLNISKSNILKTAIGVVIVLIEDVYKWWYEIWDWAGNTFKSGNYTITHDLTYPNTTNSHFTPTSVYVDNTTIIYGNISDTYLDSVWIEINYSGVYQNHSYTTSSGHSYTYSLLDTDIDNFENISWRWWANDSAGNENKSLLNSFEVINRNPYSVNITNPSNDTYTNKDSIIINFTSADSDADTINYSLYNSTDGVTYSIYNSTNSSSFINFSTYDYTDGVTHYYYITANDSRLINASENYTFTIDITNPSLTTPFTKPDESPNPICSKTNIELNYTATDTNIDYCEYNVTYGLLTSTANTVITDCSNTTFNVNYDNVVQQLNFVVHDKAGNTNSTIRLIYIDTDNPACGSPGRLGGGGGGYEEPPEERSFCGDGICQPEGNDRGLEENFWNCPQDCQGFDFDALIYALTKYCFDKNESTPCFWTQGFGTETPSICGDNICSKDENFWVCEEDCGGLNFETLAINCLDDDESTTCFWDTNLAFYVLFVGFAGFLALSFTRVKVAGKKVSIPSYIKIKTKKRWRRR